MQAIEFETQIHNSVIKIPAQFQLQTLQIARVIILLNETAETTQVMPNQSDRPLGLLNGKLNIDFANNFKMTEEEFLQP